MRISYHGISKLRRFDEQNVVSIQSLLRLWRSAASRRLENIRDYVTFVGRNCTQVKSLRETCLQNGRRIRQIGLCMGAGAVEGGEGLIEPCHDPLLLFQWGEGDGDRSKRFSSYLRLGCARNDARKIDGSPEEILCKPHI